MVETFDVDFTILLSDMGQGTISFIGLHGSTPSKAKEDESGRLALQQGTRGDQLIVTCLHHFRPDINSHPHA